jgi:hypothetical protein
MENPVTSIAKGVLLADRATIMKDAWSRGRLIEGIDPDVFRKDEYGNWLKYDEFLAEKAMGWDVERRYSPVSYGSAFYPVARSRVKRIYMEVEKIIEKRIKESALE